ncbi:MAG: helix-turn-helix domain-containing protein [Oscillospiraceae bacterium]
MDFPAHLHPPMELALIREGMMKIGYDDSRFLTLFPGDAALFMPNQIHSFSGKAGSTMFSLVFPQELVPAFASLMEQKEPSSPYLRPSRELLELLYPMETAPTSPLRLKGILYLLCSEFLEQCKLVDASSNHSLLRACLVYIQKNLSNPQLSLKAMAHELGYDYHYLSRYLNRGLTIPFTRYVRQQRVSHAAYLLQHTTSPICQIAQECGFGCIRTFNQVFLEIAKTTPRQLRRQMQEEAAVHLRNESLSKEQN